MDSTDWGSCFFDHYEKYLGTPREASIFEANPPLFRMRIIPFDDVFGGCRAFCSFGLSRYAEKLGEAAEIFMPVDEAWDDTPEILARVLFKVATEHNHMGWGWAVPIDKSFSSFVATFGKTAIYFADPFGVPKGFESVHCGDTTGSVYLACYITQNEFDFLKIEGCEEFEACLEENDVDVFNISRRSCI